MSEAPEAPKIVFPCEKYPIKVMGPSAPDFKAFVLDIIKSHDSTHDGSATVRESRKGNFQAINVSILAVSAAQIEALYIDLKASKRVTMVL